MFDMSKMGDMMKLANDAKAMQREQERDRKEQIDMLKRISEQLETVIQLLGDQSRRG